MSYHWSRCWKVPDFSVSSCQVSLCIKRESSRSSYRIRNSNLELLFTHSRLWNINLASLLQSPPTPAAAPDALLAAARDNIWVIWLDKPPPSIGLARLSLFLTLDLFWSHPSWSVSIAHHLCLHSSISQSHSFPYRGWSQFGGTLPHTSFTISDHLHPIPSSSFLFFLACSSRSSVSVFSYPRILFLPASWPLILSKHIPDLIFPNTHIDKDFPPFSRTISSSSNIPPKSCSELCR